MKLPLILLHFLYLVELGSAVTIKIGAIFYDNDADNSAAFDKAIAMVKKERQSTVIDLESVIRRVSLSTDSFDTAKKVCELLQNGVAAIFGPSSTNTRAVVASIASRYNIPHIEYTARSVDDTTLQNATMTVNFYPDGKLVSKAIADVLMLLNWKSFSVVYETNEGLARLQNALMTRKHDSNPITIRQLGSGPDYYTELKELSGLNICNILLDVEPQHVEVVLKQAKKMKLLTDYCTYFITYLDGTKLNISSAINGTNANITAFMLMEDEYNRVATIEAGVLYDSIFLFHKAVETIYSRNINVDPSFTIVPESISCGDMGKYSIGLDIVSLMREMSKVGKLTGTMTLDDHGRRHFDLQVVEIRTEKYFKVGYWTEASGFTISRSDQEIEKSIAKEVTNKVFRVVSISTAPYVIEVTDGSSRGVEFKGKQGKRYEGFCIDLIERVADMCGFVNEYELAPKQGSYNEKTKQWDGMIGKLLNHEADLAIGDLTITHERQKFVDFTMPFMNLGISILYSKPEAKEPNLFSFLSPFSTKVWIYMAAAYLAVSVLLFIQARITPIEWNNPHPCNLDPEELENDFNLLNSLWFTIGSLMQQGCDLLPKMAPGEWTASHPCDKDPEELEFEFVLFNSLWHNIGSLMQQGSDLAPKAPSIRMIAALWWFFVLIMASSYTANLAAFLTSDKMDNTISSADDLAKQSKIKYGVLRGGSTASFFEQSNFSTYQRMWSAMMETKPSVFTSTSKEGVERVIKGKGSYAFFMESTSIEYETERRCELQRVGALLDSKGYGIALPPNSPYRTMISEAVLKLQEKGVLEEMKKTWWIERGGGRCADEEQETTTSGELGMANVGGVFLVLGCGCGIAFGISIFEFLWNVKKIAVEEKVTPWEALKAEMKFVVNIWQETKPVKISNSRSTSGSREGGLGRAASTARSIVGSFLRLDIIDKENNKNINNKNNKMN